MAELISCFANPVTLVSAEQADVGVSLLVGRGQKANVPAATFGQDLFGRAISVNLCEAGFCGCAPAPKDYDAAQGGLGADVGAPIAEMPRTRC